MDFLASRLPIVAAPMAGVSTPELGGAVSSVGAFPFLAGGYQTVDRLADDMARAKSWDGGFGVNLFAPGAEEPGDDVIAAYARGLRGEFDRFGIPVPAIRRGDDDHWCDKLDLLVSDPVPVVSFTFGLPEVGVVKRLKAAGTMTMATVTTTDEARRAEEVGMDALIVQGPQAGGHSATWDPARRIGDSATADVVRQIRAVTSRAIIGAGGVAGPEAVTQILAAGAQAVAVGTILLRCPEAGTSAVHRRALADPRFDETTLTRTFTGRPARALTNGFIRDHRHEEITAYPAVHHLTAPLRAEAVRRGDADRAHLWAGTGFRAASDQPAGRIVLALASGL